jgi:hypothetical protein
MYQKKQTGKSKTSKSKKEAEDLAKLKELENKIGAPHSDKAVRESKRHKTQAEIQEEKALKVRNPFRGI